MLNINRLSKSLFVKTQDNLSTICITRWLNTRTYWSSNNNSAICIHFHSEGVLLWFVHLNNNANYIQIIIKDIEIEKIRWVFQNSFNDFVVSGFGDFPHRSIVKNWHLFMPYSWIWQLSVTWSVVYLHVKPF